MEKISHKTTFDYPYLQALLKESRKVQSQSLLGVPEFLDLRDLNEALKKAYENRSAKGCLEGFIDVLGKALHLGILLRYNDSSLNQSDISDLTFLYDTVTKNLMGDNKSIFKFILGQVSPNLMH